MQTEKQQHIMGLWKFRDTVPLETLRAVAALWAREPRYIQLYVRKTSKDQIGIGFSYQLLGDESGRQAQDNYFETTSDLLRRKFGNDLVGWDLATPVEIIK